MIPGSPLTVYVGPLGECQSSYAEHGDNFYNPSFTIGDCGFFLAFPSQSAGKVLTGQPTALEGTTWGFGGSLGSAGPHIPGDGYHGEEYTAIGHSAVTGAGTEASPYVQTTVFAVKEGGTEYARITETTTYVNGAPQFTSTYDVKNMQATGNKIYFRAIYAGDMYLLGSDFGTGVVLAGPPSFVGGQNPESGSLGGLIEASGLAWSSFEEGCWDETGGERDEAGEGGRCFGALPSDQGIWHDVRTSDEEPNAFNKSVDPADIDNAVGVEWDQLRETGTGLEGQAEQSFTIINRTQIPSTLQISPVNQTLTQGQTATVTVTATDLSGAPYAGKVLHYTISGANPQAGTVTLNAGGAAQISYVGNNAGIDTDQLFVDLTGSGAQAAGDPASAATVTFVPRPPTPNSTYKVESIHANSNGTITITFVPTQAGTASLLVTVPTGTIARNEALAAKSKKCKKGQVKIKGKCLPANTVSGKVSAAGLAGVTLKLTVNPSSKVKKALAKGKTVTLTAKLTYKSALGGTPTVKVFHEKVKGKKKKHH